MAKHRIANDAQASNGSMAASLPLPRRSTRAVRTKRSYVDLVDDGDHDSNPDQDEYQDHSAGSELDEQHRPPPLKSSTSGVSTKKFPPISETTFGLLQEKLWREPFWLLIAVTFLNKTAGRSAAPVFWKLKELYPTAADLAAANEAELIELIRHLGLQTQRARRLIKMATAWSAQPACRGLQSRTHNYPLKGDGKAGTLTVESDPQQCAGSLEIGHIPGCGQYAWDSWRIFCRDVLRGVADDYNGLNASPGFEPEWKRVVPLDKELRAYLRWMWLREGYVWNHENGDKRPVTKEERLRSIKGELEPTDEKEAQYTAQAKQDIYMASDGEGTGSKAKRKRRK